MTKKQAYEKDFLALETLCKRNNKIINFGIMNCFVLPLIN